MNLPQKLLGPAVERRNKGTLFSVVYFSRGPSLLKGKRAPLGTLVPNGSSPEASKPRPAPDEGAHALRQLGFPACPR